MAVRFQPVGAMSAERERERLRKRIPLAEVQQQRREAALQRQRAERARATAWKREEQPESTTLETLAASELNAPASSETSMEDGSVERTESAHATASKRRTSAFASRHLMRSEWLLQAPDDLILGSWFLMARPVGTRCLLVAHNGQTVSRDVTGAVLETFSSPLPNGSKHHPSARKKGSCILDAVLVPEGDYYALDCMCWNGHAFYNCDTEFRLFFLRNQLAELSASNGSSRRILHALYDQASSQTIRSALDDGAFGYSVDSFVFTHKESHYEPGFSPLSLLWKPMHASRDGNPLSLVVKVNDRSGYLVSLDGWGVGRLNLDSMHSREAEACSSGAAVQVRIGSQGIDFDSSANGVRRSDLHFESASMSEPQTLSEIAFRYWFHESPESMTLQALTGVQ